MRYFKKTNLVPRMVDGRIVLVWADIDISLIDELGRTNLQQMKLGLTPLGATGKSLELHPIGQEVDATLAIRTQTEHHNPDLHLFREISEIDREKFAIPKRRFWKDMVRLLQEGGL